MDRRYSKLNVAVYFSGNMGNLYQIQQWIKPFEALNQQEEIVIIVRNLEVYAWIQEYTEFQLAYTKTMTSLLKLYEDSEFKCILYVNNSCTNFQSLSNNTALHIHINHGESEKTSTFSNRAKSYDFVFIVAEAAYEKYMNNLIYIDKSKFVKIGRPQIDFIDAVKRPKTNKKIILYAPTWEGTHFSMNYTSLPNYGVDFVNKIIKQGDYYLIYRPHPNTGSRDPKTKAADQKIKRIVHQSQHAKVMAKEDINSVFSLTDLAIFDNSAVTVDFLNVEKPMLMTDYFYRQKGQATGKPKMIKACELINDANKDDILGLIKTALNHDPKAVPRKAMKRYFLGDYAQGESTQAFIGKIQELIIFRDQLINSA